MKHLIVAGMLLLLVSLGAPGLAFAGGWHVSRWSHHWNGTRSWGVAVWGRPWRWNYGYYRYPRYYGAYAPVYPPYGYGVTARRPAPLPSYWYYCQSSQAFYPYVTSCPAGWKAIPTSPSPG